MPSHRFFERVEADAVLGEGGHLERAQVQALEHLEQAEVGRRLDRDGVAGPGHRLEAEADRVLARRRW